jgi:hypothetical protein
MHYSFKGLKTLCRVLSVCLFFETILLKKLLILTLITTKIPREKRVYINVEFLKRLMIKNETYLILAVIPVFFLLGYTLLRTIFGKIYIAICRTI